MKQQTCLRCGEHLPAVTDAFCPSCREPLDSPPNEVAAVSIRPKTLALLLKYKASPPTVGWFLLRSVPVHLFLVTLLGGIAGVFTLLGAETAAAAMLGALGGILLRDVGWFLRISRTWPEQAAIMDWERIEQLARGETAPPASTNPP